MQFLEHSALSLAMHRMSPAEVPREHLYKSAALARNRIALLVKKAWGTHSPRTEKNTV